MSSDLNVNVNNMHECTFSTFLGKCHNLEKNIQPMHCQTILHRIDPWESRFRWFWLFFYEPQEQLIFGSLKASKTQYFKAPVPFYLVYTPALRHNQVLKKESNKPSMNIRPSVHPHTRNRCQNLGKLRKNDFSLLLPKKWVKKALKWA